MANERGIMVWMYISCFLVSMAISNNDSSFTLSEFESLPECICKNNKELLCKDKQLTSIPNIEDYDCDVEKVDISRNEISIVTRDAFINSPKLKIIYLYMDEIDKIETETFSNVKDLEEVDLSDNDLLYIDPDMFVNNTKLKNVNLAGNPLVDVAHSTSILNGPSITTLNLSGCKLSVLNLEMFSKLPNLNSLDLSSNNLAVIPFNTFSCMPSLTHLELNNNRWDCNCQLQTLIQFAKSIRYGAPDSGSTPIKPLRPIRCSKSNVNGVHTWTRFKTIECQSEDRYTTDCIAPPETLVDPYISIVNEMTIPYISFDYDLTMSDISIKNPPLLDLYDEVNDEYSDEAEIDSEERRVILIEYDTPYVVLAVLLITLVIVVVFLVVKCCTCRRKHENDDNITSCVGRSKHYSQNIVEGNNRNTKLTTNSIVRIAKGTGITIEDLPRVFSNTNNPYSRLPSE